MARNASFMLKFFCGFPATFHPVVVLRTPLYPYAQLPSAIDLVEGYKCGFFQEALYLASPSFKSEVDKLLESGNLSSDKAKYKLHKLHKYWIRAHSRTTPFGLFASCSTLKWMPESTNIVLERTDNLMRQTRLDMGFLCQMVSKLSSSLKIRERLVWYPNTSIYYIKDELRYVEYKYFGTKRVYQRSSAELDVYLKEVLSISKGGVSFRKLIVSLNTLDSEITAEEATGYVSQLIDEQILVSHLEPGSTGGDPLQHIINFLEKNLKGLSDDLITHANLKNLSEMIKKLDQGMNSLDYYESILSYIDSFNIPYSPGKLFHVAVKKNNLGQAKLSSSIQEKVAKAAELLIKVNYKKSTDIPEFIRSFRQQYESQEIPLLEVLDAEIGIGYPVSNKPSIFNPFTEGILLNPAPKGSSSDNFSYDEWDLLLHSILVGAQHNRDQEIDLVKLLNKQKVLTRNVNPPESLSIRFSIALDDNGKEIIFIRPSGFASAMNLIGRFGESDSEIKKLLLDIAEFEQKSVEPAILAEIVHTSQERDGNITLRPSSRKYEIPYIGTPEVPEDYQISVDDILVSVINDKIILRSKRLNREVIPVLSCAHNYRHNTLSCYRFLSALQSQEKDSKMGFNWGAFRNMFSFFPRIMYHGVILHPAKWNLSMEDCNSLLSFPKAEQFSQLTSWRIKLGLPQRVTLINNDAELPLDLGERFAAETFLQVLRKGKSASLQEFIFDKYKSPVVDQDGKQYCNEFIATLLIDKNNNNVSTPSTYPSQENVPRRFSLGSEWLYYKIYCSPTTAENLLTKTLKPIVDALLESGAIKSWFYIRYNDPDDHLRLRFRVSSSQQLTFIIEQLLKALSPFLKARLIKKIQTDTYNRELERYGANTIELCEEWFHIDSKYVTKILAEVTKSEDNTIAWLIALRSVDHILNYFDQNIYQKLNFSSKLQENFRKEFSVPKSTSRSINLKYRKYRKEIKEVLDLQDEISDKGNLNLFKLLAEREAEAEEVFSEIDSIFFNQKNQVPLEGLISSFIHMHINRYFKDNQRFQELLIYTYLNKYYMSSVALHKINDNDK